MGFSVKKERFARGAWGEDDLYQLDLGGSGKGACVLSYAFLSLMQHPLLLLNSQTNGVIHCFATGSGGKFLSLVVNQTAP